MKIKKILMCAAAIACSAFLFAQEAEGASTESKSSGGSSAADFLKKLDYKVFVDMAYYPQSDYISGSTHFAPITGPFSAMEGRATATAGYTIPTPLGEHPLLKGAKVNIMGALELSPISFKPALEVSFDPLPFVSLSAGTSFGFGWQTGPVSGLSILFQDEHEYRNLTTFKNNFYDVWMQGTLKFDTGAVWQGEHSEWHHIVMVASYKAFYEGLTMVSNDAVWKWMGGMNRANGWQWSASGLLGYQMPLFINTVGFLGEMTGHYSSSDYKNFESWNGAFMSVDIAPFMQFAIGKKDEITTMFNFRTRRSFEEEHDAEEEEVYLTECGSEWYFRRAAIRWTHKF